MSDTEPKQLVDADGKPLNPKPPASWKDKAKEALEEHVQGKLKKFAKLVPKNLIAWLGAGFILFAVVAFAVSSFPTWSKLPYLGDVVQWAQQRAIPKSTKFSVGIAKIEGDADDALRTQMLDALRDLPHVEPLRVDRTTTLAAAGNVAAQELAHHQEFQALLKDSKNDLIVWGQVLGAVQAKDRLLRLHVTARDVGAAGTDRLAAEQVIKLPIASAALLQSAIRTQVLTRLNSFDSSKAVAKELLQEVERVAQMVGNFPQGQTRSAMLLTLGNAQLTVGE